MKWDLENILITGPVVTPKKIDRMLDLLVSCPSLMVVVDHPQSVDLLEARLRERTLSLGVLLDVDVGLHRTGVRPDQEPVLTDRIISSPHLRLQGVQAYAGQVQHIHSYQERKLASRECLQPAVRIFNRLRNLVPTCTIFSTSGTGTYDIDPAVEEITELQVGSYALMDAEYLALEPAEKDKPFASLFPPALRLLTTVVSTNQDAFVTVDAGLKSLYKDGAKPRVIVSEASSLEYEWFGDEYGKISAGNAGRLPELGSVLELVVSHCDPTVNLFDRYYLIRGEDVVGTWEIDLRGCSQ